MSKQLKTILILTMVLLMAVTSSGLVSSQEPIELEFVGWGGPEEIAVFEQLVAAFNENNPDIRIVYTPMPTDYVTSLTTMIAGGTPPDIAYVPDGDFSAFVSRDQLVNIQDLVDASETFDTENVWPSALGRYRWDEETNSLGTGDLYALPKDIGPTALYINVDLFEQAGVELPPTDRALTWDEIVEIGQQITVDANGNHPGDDGFDPNTVEVWGIGDLWFENIIYGNGGRIVSEDGREFVADDDQNTIDAMQWLSDLVHVYQVSPPSSATAAMSTGQMFETGRLAMTTNGRWATTFYRNVLPFEWDVRYNPVGPSGAVTTYNNQEDCVSSGWSGSVGLAIIAGSDGEENREEAYRFIEFIASAEGQTEQAALGFQIPNQLDLAETDVFLQPDQNPANAQIFLDLARCELPGPWTQTPLFGQWFDDLWRNGVIPSVIVDNTELAEDAIIDRADAFQEGLDEAWASIED